MIVGFDLDEILANFLPALLRYHNDEYGSSLRRDDFHSYHFWEIWGGTKEEAIQKVYDFHGTSYFENIQPVNGSVDGISKLKRDHDLVIITSRQDDVAEATNRWITKHFSDVFSGIYFSNAYAKNGSAKKKSDICRNLGVEVMVEDSLDYANDCASSVRRVLLLDCPWNQSNQLSSGIKRVQSGYEIIWEI